MCCMLPVVQGKLTASLLLCLCLQAPAAGPLLGGKGPTAANGPTAADRFAHLEYWPLVNAR